MTSILFGIVRICVSLFKRTYLKNEKIFLNFLFLFRNLHQILNIFLKKKIVIANVFPKLETVKDLVRGVSKRHHLRTFFESRHVKGSQTRLKSAWERFYDSFSSLWVEIIWKISLLLKFEILSVFVKTFTAGDKYPVRDCQNLSFTLFKRNYLKKEKLFLRFCFLFRNFHEIFKLF